jgi:hypothetical protein
VSFDYTDCSLVECHGDRDVASAELGVHQRLDARLHDARTHAREKGKTSLPRVNNVDIHLGFWKTMAAASIRSSSSHAEFLLGDKFGRGAMMVPENTKGKQISAAQSLACP